jgi:hypothetical protein
VHASLCLGLGPARYMAYYIQGIRYFFDWVLVWWWWWWLTAARCVVYVTVHELVVAPAAVVSCKGEEGEGKMLFLSL